MNLRLVLFTPAIALMACSGAEGIGNIAPENARHCDYNEVAEEIRCDEQTYHTEKINGRVWMAENLNFNYSPAGDFCYDDDEQYCAIFGRLYKASEMYKPLCPEGFRLPMKEELIAALKGNYFEEINTNSGFRILKSGMRDTNGYYYDTGKSASFWVDDNEEYEEGEDSTAYLVRVTDAEVSLELHDVHTSASIRCIRN